METAYREQFIKFGLKVQYYRKLHGLTQEAFADAIGKSWSFVAKIESPTQAFGVSMETILFVLIDRHNDKICHLLLVYTLDLAHHMPFYRYKVSS